MDSRKLRILHIVEAMGGGVFTYIVDMANELSKEHDIYVAYAVRPQTPKDYKRYFNKKVHLIEVENFTREINFAKDIKAYKEIKQIARNINPDIIHLHSSKAGILGRMAFNGKKVPLFYTPHGYSFLMRDHSSGKRKLYKVLEKTFARRNCTTISCSPGEHEETLKLTKKAVYVNNGINMKELEPFISNCKIESEHNATVFTLGRICYQKNPGMFNEIALKLPDIKFIWIGDGELRELLTAPNIEIAGWLERQDALKRTRDANIFLLTSLWEGLPISLLEAMYTGKVCAVSNVIGNRDVIKNGINGYVCDSVDSFIEAIQKIMNENHIYMTNKAQSDIISTYNTLVMAKEYEKIYCGCKQ